MAAVMFQVPLREAAVVAVCVTAALVAAAVIGPVQCPTLSIRSGRFGGSDDGCSDDGCSVMAQQAALAGLSMQMGVSVRSGRSTSDWAHHDWETRVINGVLVVMCFH